jgi:hypothetical protein
VREKRDVAKNATTKGLTRLTYKETWRESLGGEVFLEMISPSRTRGDFTMPTKMLPSGGPLKLDARVAEMFRAHVELHCHAVNSAGERTAKARRDKLLSELSGRDRYFARVLAETLALDLKDAMVMPGAQTSRRERRAA